MSGNDTLTSERNRTHPDYVVFTPTSLDGSTGDTGNEQPCSCTGRASR